MRIALLTLLLLGFGPLSSQRGWVEFQVEEGRQNFTPSESILPFRIQEDSLRIRMLFDPSAYWSLDDWEGDRDYFDWNKGIGFTAALSANNKNAVFVGWRPSTQKPFTIEVVAYVNDQNRSWNISEILYVRPIDTITLEVGLEKDSVNYTLSGGVRVIKGTLPWRRPWYRYYRRSGTWIGGANNSPGQYGGEATQRIIISGDFLRY